MQLSAVIKEKIIGSNKLFKDLELSIAVGEKVAIIGRNGVGKTSLFRILSGEDKDYEGEVQYRRGTTVMMTAQDHLNNSDGSCIEYILASLPRYAELHSMIQSYPQDAGNNLKKIGRYT